MLRGAPRARRARGTRPRSRGRNRRARGRNRRARLARLVGRPGSAIWATSRITAAKPARGRWHRTRRGGRPAPGLAGEQCLLFLFSSSRSFTSLVNNESPASPPSLTLGFSMGFIFVAFAFWLCWVEPWQLRQHLHLQLHLHLLPDSRARSHARPARADRGGAARSARQ